MTVTWGPTNVDVARVFFGESGGWRADLVLQSGADLPAVGSTAAFALEDLSLLGGRVDRASFDVPTKPHIVVVGGREWHQEIARPISFQSDGGVRLATVLDAISAGAGAKIEKPADVTIGDYYEIVASREGETVTWNDALNDLVRGGYLAPWRFDPDGVTRFGTRTSAPVTGTPTILSRDASDGSITYTFDSLAKLLPANTIANPDGTSTGIGRVKFMINKARVGDTRHIQIWPSEIATLSIAEQVRRVVALAFQDMLRTYIVASVGGDGRLDLAPPADAQHLPELKRVEQWTLGGVKYKPTPGQFCVVAFRDVKKTRPVVVGFQLDPTGVFSPAAREGDSVTIFFPPSLPVAGNITGFGPFTGLLTIPGPGTGMIVTGSAKVDEEI